MQIFCSIVTLMFINGSYFFISFNMDSMLEQSIEDDTEELVSISNVLPWQVGDYSSNFDPIDLLDLDIFDFDINELENKHKKDEYTSNYSLELIL